MRQPKFDMIYEFTSIGRPLDPTYPTNLAIMLLTPLGGALAGLLTLLRAGDLGAAITAGFFAGAALAIAWVLAREIAPDDEYAAFAAAGLALLGALLSPANPDILPLATLIILLRIVNRVVGQPAKLTDLLPALILSAFVIFGGGWTFALVAFAAFALDALLPDRLRAAWGFALAVGVVLAAYAISNGLSAPGAFSGPLLLGAVAVAALYAVNIATTTTVVTLADHTRQPLNLARVRAAMGLALLAGIAYLWFGDAGVVALLPLWAALLATAAWRLSPLSKIARPSFARIPAQKAR